MKYFSTFSGIGGFELGIKQSYVETTTRSQERRGQEDTERNEGQGLLTTKGEGSSASTRQSSEHVGDESDEGQPTCVGYSEIDKYAIQIYQKHFNHKNYGDITKINEEELPDFDLIVGGFPCQSFSIAGKRGGFADTRGTLFFEIARIIRKKQPRLLLLENVKGLLSHDKGRTFTTIVSTLDELGYDIQWQVLNSKNFGVPQNRERVFIVGHLRGTSRPEVFPIEATNRATTFSKTIRTGGSKSLTKKHAWDLIQINKPKHSNDRVYGTDGISPTLNTMQGGNRQPFVATRNDGMEVEMEISNAVTPDAYLTSGKRKVVNGKSVLTSMYDRRIRRLTPTECERLQGFPDGWTEGVSDTQRYKCLGNAVTVNVIEAIMKKLSTIDKTTNIVL